MGDNLIKNLIAAMIVIGLVLVTYLYQENIANYINTIFFPKEKIIIKDANQYTRSYVYEQYQMTTDFEPDSKKELLNIFYTILNSGWKSFFFYCPASYQTCLNDVYSILDDQTLLSTVNNYVSPYNSFSEMKASMDGYGKVTITPDYVYNKEMITAINTKLNEVETGRLNATMNTRDKIRTLHDYIINTTKYDSVMVNSGVNNYKANTAYGPLMNGYAICGGYSDAMALFLDRLDIPNYKITSTDHIWNYLLVDGSWYHLDLTWDDPISASGEDRLIYTYFLITTEQLDKLNTSGNHTFNDDYY